jgi:hypothetical protein
MASHFCSEVQHAIDRHSQIGQSFVQDLNTRFQEFGMFQADARTEDSV